jgi:hypothetical protein
MRVWSRSQDGEVDSREEGLCRFGSASCPRVLCALAGPELHLAPALSSESLRNLDRD